MKFIVNNEKKIIIGWNGKCGCSHIKTIYLYLKKKKLENKIHTHEVDNKLPENVRDYTTIIICRNPYERVVSGFLDKYKINGEFRRLFNQTSLTFSQFVDELILAKWKKVDYHHFTPQLSDNFSTKLLFSKQIYFFDIANIDYNLIEQLFQQNIPPEIKTKKQGHERQFFIKNDLPFEQYVYDLDINSFIERKVQYKYFFNKQIQQKIYHFYIQDFLLFKQFGLDYTLQE